MKQLFNKRKTRGASLIEYGVLAGIIAVLSMFAVLSTGNEVSRLLGLGASTIESADIGNGVPATGGPGPVNAAWEVPSEDLGHPPGGMVVTYIGSSAQIGVLTPGGTQIHWGDGAITTTTDGYKTYTHSYGDTGEHDIVIDGAITKLNDLSKNIKYVKSFGNGGITSINNSFNGSNLLERVAPIPTTVTDMQVAFYGSSANIVGLASWDVSNVTLMGSMFANYDGSIDDISGWDISSVSRQELRNLFSGSRINLDLSALCVSHIGSEPDNWGGDFLTGQPNWGAPCS